MAQKEPRFLDVKENDGYFGIRRVYIPKDYENTLLRRKYDATVEQHIRTAIEEVNKIRETPERKAEMVRKLEEMLG
jgi:hypothetical protein